MKKVILIVGASSGIGLRLASHLKDEGITVLNVSRSKCKIEGVENLKADAKVYGELTAAVNRAAKKHNRLDAVVYCAGISIAGSLEMTPIEKAKELFDTNFWGAVELSKAVIPIMREQKSGGKILFIGSLAGQIPLPFEAFYSSSKAALSSLAKNLSIELKGFNIQVGCLCPGGTATPFTEKRVVFDSEDSPYSKDVAAAVKTISVIELDGANASNVARKIACSLLGKQLPLDCPVGLSNRLTCYAYRVMPVRLSNWLVGSMFQASSDTVN